MMRSLPLVLLVAPLAAQEVTLKAGGTEEPLGFRIETRLEIETTREMTRDGEPFEGRFGRRGGGGGPTVISQKIEFVQGPPSSNWRRYQVIEAVDKTTGRDGEPRESTVTGALKGRKVFVRLGEDGNTVLVEGEGDDEQVLPAMLARGIAPRVDLGGLLPGRAIEVGTSYELGDGLRKALAGLVHPVTPERAGRGGGGRSDRGGRGERGDRGNRGRRLRGGSGTQVIRLIQNDKLACEGEATLESVEDGLATLAIEGRIHGEGSLEELGMGGFGGRRGRGRGPEGQGKVAIAIDGTATVDVATGLVTGIDLEGRIDHTTERSFTMRGDEGGEVEVESKTGGSFSLKATSAKVE